MGNDNTSLVTVERTVRILEILADADKGVSLAEISRMLIVNKSIAVRILTTLEALGYIYRNNISETYHLTYKISNLGFRQLSSSYLLDQAKRFLYDLAEKCQELVRLALVDNGELVWVFAAAGRRHRLQIGRVDENISYHGHATGKAYLSTLSEREIRGKLGSSIPRHTEATITSIDGILAEVAEVRAKGYAVSWEEREKGVVAVASPITVVGPRGHAECVGTLSIAAPSPRVDKDIVADFGVMLVETCSQLANVWPLSDLPQQDRVMSDRAY